jgi:uncharacterized membrane protein HdeD (DUF308 family)
MESAADRFTNVTGTQLKKWRWAIGLQGLASVVFGVVILVWPELSIYALTIVFGIFTLATGITSFVAAFSSELKEERGSLILSGLLGIVVGIVVLAWPSISALALLYVIGVYAILLGVLAIVASMRLPLDGSETALMILNGLIAIVFGIVIFAKPGAGALAVLALIAAFALIVGVTQLAVAFAGRQILERTAKESRLAPRSTPQPSH